MAPKISTNSASLRIGTDIHYIRFQQLDAVLAWLSGSFGVAGAKLEMERLGRREILWVGKGGQCSSEPNAV